MSVELTLLVWSTALLGAYLTAQSLLYRRDLGIAYAASARDEEPEQSVLTRRADRALRNFLETYGAFIALVIAIELSGRSDWLTQWGAQIWFWARWPYLALYLLGVAYVRSLFWCIAALGLAMMFLGAAF